jgi:hypothetical protein
MKKHYAQIAVELQKFLGVEDIQTVAEMELKYNYNDGNKYVVS